MYQNLLSNLIKNLIINKNNNNSLIYKNNNNKNIISNYNNKWDYSNIFYNYNNNILLSNLKFKYIIKKYINYMFNHKLNNIKYNILYKNPIILYNNTKNNYEIILFVYKPFNIRVKKELNSNDLLITKLIDHLISDLNNNEIFKNYNLNINIKPIILTYDYLDSDIYSKSLSKHLSKYPRLDTIKNVKINQKILNNILINKLNKNEIIKNINTLIDSKIKINHNIFNYSENYISKDIILYSNLLHQYMIGNIFKYRGKNFNSESNARALKSWNDNKLNKSLSLISLNNKGSFKLNYYLSSLTLSQSNVISKNGKYNVKVKLNHF